MQLSQEGFFKGPSESEESFLKRVALYKNPTAILKELNLPPRDEALYGFFNFKELLDRFDINPRWIYLISSNDKLMPWEAASTWIIDVKDIGSYPILQFRKKKSYLGYDFQEIFVHEVLHAVRLPLNSRRFEEIICYRASKSKFRRLFGGIFLNPQETLLYMIVWLISILGSLAFTLFEKDFFFFLGLISFGLATFLTIFGLVRLSRSHRIINKAMKRVSEAKLIRLTDEEIIAVAKQEDLLEKGLSL